MDKHIPSHLIPFLDEYERQNISEMEEVFSIKQDGMTRAERRAWKRKISKAKLKTNNKVNVITNGFHNSKKGNKIMTKEETKQRVAVMQAYVEGKQVQVYDISVSKWFDTDAPSWITSRQFRIKPEPSYRPFRNAEECWQEMLKHQPFGIVSSKHDKAYMAFESLDDGICNFNGYREESFESAFDDIQFADGAPFGIKTEQ